MHPLAHTALPVSALPGAVWPAVPTTEGARMLALQYQFEQTQWWPPEQIAAMQLQQFRQVYAHALATVPFYQQQLAGRAAAEVTDWNRYRELPVITRSAVQQAGAAMHSAMPPREHGALTRTESSGSSGAPLVTPGTQWTQLMWQALLLREHLWHGRDLSGKLAAIRSKTAEARFPAWGPATAAFVTGPSVVRDLSADLDEQLQWLVRENPDYLMSYATNVQALAARSLELDLRLPRLKQVRTYGEMLRPEARGIVREAWGVEIADSYSAEELGYIALQCPESGQYHVQAESLMVEVLKPDGAPCLPGETGQLVVSTLHNFAMPLIRYASGDYAEVAAPCACGRGLPALRRIVGRQRNMLVRPDGVRHWPSFPSEAWREIAPVVQIQLIQDAVDHIEARLVMARDLTDGEAGRLIVALQECLGYPFRITLQRVDVIPRSASQKYEDFISLLAESAWRNARSM